MHHTRLTLVILRAARLLCLMILAGGAFPGSAFAQNERGLQRFHTKYTERKAAFAESLATFAAELKAQDQLAGVEAIRVFSTVAPATNGLQVLPKVPRKLQPQIPVGIPPAERAWQLKFQKLRQDEANELYLLSREVLQANHASLSYEIVYEVVRLDPDHPAARRVLGFVQSGDEWLTPFEAERLRKKEIWDARFGWIPADELPKYEQGLRKHRNRWIPAAQEAEIRRDFDNGWVIPTEHFLVKTNHSLEKGVEVAGKLEDYYQFFIRAFPGLFNTREQMRGLHSPSATRAATRRKLFDVHLYRDRNEYVSRLRKQIPVIAQTNGLYHQRDMISYFFVDKGTGNDATIYHEATHQILFESRGRMRDVGMVRNFWVVEGFACYMESYRITDGEVSLGDPWFIRFDNARSRLLLDRYYRRLADFTSWGQEEFQQQKELPMNYSQSSGLVHFFLHAQEGKYRDAFIDHIAAMYNSSSPNDRDVPSLDKLAEVSFDELDKEYILYLKRQADDLASQPEPDYVRIEREAEEAQP